MRIRIDHKLPQQCPLIPKVSRHATGKKFHNRHKLHTHKKTIYFNAVISWTWII